MICGKGSEPYKRESVFLEGVEEFDEFDQLYHDKLMDQFALLAGGFPGVTPNTIGPIPAFIAHQDAWRKSGVLLLSGAFNQVWVEIQDT